uniref:Uncharacterized protein n=1 Tax=Ditylenchus dipsaci TaxID=166011 RepID=A0A915CLA1_9BILA
MLVFEVQARVVCKALGNTNKCLAKSGKKKSMLKVRELLHAVGKKCGVDPYVIDNMDLENIVERAVAINEGRVLPDDNNEEPLPPNEPSPEPIQEDFNENIPPKKDPFLTPPITIRRHFVETLSDNSTSPTALPTPTKPFDNCALVAIDMPEDYAEEQALDWNEPMVVVGRPEQYIVERAAEIASPDKLDSTLPIVILDEVDTPEEPKKFKEKKQKYGRDPKKLLATYQEEWDRLERMSDRKLGPRRKSVLALNSSTSPVATTSTIAISPSPSLPITATIRLMNNNNNNNDGERGGEVVEGDIPTTSSNIAASTTSRSRSPTPTKIKKKVLSPPSTSNMERRATSPTAAKFLAAAAINAERRDSAAASSRRSSSSAGIKKIIHLFIEGRELPDDNNEEPLPPNEPSPEPIQEDFNDNIPPKKDPFLTPPITIRRHFVETLSDNSTSPTALPTPTKPFDNCALVAIDMPEDYAEEQALDWNEPMVVVGRPEQYIVERAAEIASPDKLDSTLPIVILDEVDTPEEPKKFKEKKQKYGRDPKKLLATYQEEWDRLERMSDRKLGQEETISPSPSLPITATIRLMNNNNNNNDGERVVKSRSPTPTKIKKKVLSPPSTSNMERRATSPTAAKFLAAAAINAERRDSAAASSRRSSSSAGIKRLIHLFIVNLEK